MPPHNISAIAIRERGWKGKPLWTAAPVPGTFPTLITGGTDVFWSRPAPAPPGVWARVQDLILPIAMVASLLVIVVPVPAGLMDVLLASNITIAVIMLLTTLYVRTPLEFNIFPSLLLATTLFRLVLNVATTRLILTRAAADGQWAAGGVVRTFGQFVTGSSGTGTDKIVVGLIIFSIIVLIQFVVITKGATRISEVAARFTLDGMPGKQMAVDADLNAGVIDQHEAQQRRQEISQQADFFGAMDGASKFVRGDAIAGIVIILINIIGGLFIGIVENGMSLADAAKLFTLLTIGDGLVTQVPAFLISLAAGMLVTRSNQASNLPGEFVRQLFSRPQALAVAAGFLGILIFTSLPRIPLLLLAAGCVGMAVTLSRRETKVKAAQATKQSASHQAVATAGRGLPGRRSDGVGAGRRTAPPGRSEARRRSAGPHRPGAADRGRRDRHHPAPSPRPRQHATRRLPIFEPAGTPPGRNRGCHRRGLRPRTTLA